MAELNDCKLQLALGKRGKKFKNLLAIISGRRSEDNIFCCDTICGESDNDLIMQWWMDGEEKRVRILDGGDNIVFEGNARIHTMDGEPQTKLSPLSGRYLVRRQINLSTGH